MRPKYNPHGWYKMRNEKIVEQAKTLRARSIAEYWHIEASYVRQILKAEDERRANAG